MNTVYHPCPHAQTGGICVLGLDTSGYGSGAAGIFATEENSFATDDTPDAVICKGSPYWLSSMEC